MRDEAFDTCAALLPRELAEAVDRAAAGRSFEWEEIRLRAGRGISLVNAVEECPVECPEGIQTIGEQELRTVLERATQSSYQSAAEQLSRGFYTLRGGHRIGICGSVYHASDRVPVFRTLSSLCIRIARAHPGAAEGLRVGLLEHGQFPGTLILSPPGGGKTTLLRELLRLLSDEFHLRTAVADERGEVAALWHGVPQLNVGRNTDVLDGCPRAEGLLMLLRSMTPQVLAVDEITDPADVRALSVAANCGVSLLATVHGGSLEELLLKPIYRRLREEHLFARVILIGRTAAGARSYRMEPLAW